LNNNWQLAALLLVWESRPRDEGCPIPAHASSA